MPQRRSLAIVAGLVVALLAIPIALLALGGARTAAPPVSSSGPVAAIAPDLPAVTRLRALEMGNARLEPAKARAPDGGARAPTARRACA